MTGYPGNRSSEKPPDPDVPGWVRRSSNNEPMADTRLRAFIGDKWESTYRKKFAPFIEDPAFVPTWNWGAFFPIPLWFLYRKLYLAFIFFLFAPGIAAKWVLGSAMPATPPPNNLADPENLELSIAIFSFVLAAMVAMAGTANWLLFRRARAAAEFVASQQLPDDEALTMLSQIGGVHRGPTVLLAVLMITPVLMQVCTTATG